MEALQKKKKKIGMGAVKVAILISSFNEDNLWVVEGTQSQINICNNAISGLMIFFWLNGNSYLYST